MKKRWILALVALFGAVPLGAVIALFLAGQGRNMIVQPKYQPFEAASLFPDGKVNQEPLPGTVGRGDLDYLRALETRPPMTRALLERGRQRFEIYCTPCHGALGDGRGMVVQRGFPQPPSYHTERLRQKPAAYIVRVITEGRGDMFSYASRVPPADRWAIAGYIKALQLSRRTPVAELPADLAAAVREAGP